MLMEDGTVRYLECSEIENAINQSHSIDNSFLHTDANLTNVADIRNITFGLKNYMTSEGNEVNTLVAVFEDGTSRII